jgi:hypothetical protein
VVVVVVMMTMAMAMVAVVVLMMTTESMMIVETKAVAPVVAANRVMTVATKAVVAVMTTKRIMIVETKAVAPVMTINRMMTVATKAVAITPTIMLITANKMITVIMSHPILQKIQSLNADQIASIFLQSETATLKTPMIHLDMARLISTQSVFY